ncbi:MAG TPA: N-acetylmuramoyl-L-alanine amidase [Bacillota bacterium]|nr:N-acetylmuramoyl-L-alanine amidase [Bacillota bacterium]
MKFGCKLTKFSAGTLLLALMTAILAMPAFASDRVQPTGSYTNVRSMATTKSSIVGKIIKGNTYSVLKEVNGWVQVALPGGQKGWVAGWLVKKITVASTASTTNKNTTAANQTPASTKGVITGTYVNLRSGPGTAYTSTGKVLKGEKLTILKQQGEWYQVKLAKGTQGWIAGWLMKKIPAGGTSTSGSTPVSNPPRPTSSTSLNMKGSITGSVVNLRSGPGTAFGIVAKSYKGTVVTILKQQGDWYQVKLAKGTQGWVAGWLVVAISETRTDPSSEPAGKPSGGTASQGSGSPAPVEPASEPESGSEPATQPSGAQTPAKISIAVSINSDNFPVVMITGDNTLEYTEGDSQTAGTYVLNVNGAELVHGDQIVNLGQAGLNSVQSQKSLTDPAGVTVTLTMEQNLKFVCTRSEDKKVLTLTGKQVSQTAKIIAIDAGHGGIDPGAVGPSKLQEKEVVLAISNKLATRLEQAGYKVVLTRPDDVKIALTERSVIAAQNNADIFVSIHANASETSYAKGTSTYYYAPSTVERLKAQQAERASLARKVQDRLVAALGRKDLGILQANFAVLRETTMPSILVETAYISNPEEEIMLGQDNVQEIAAEAIFRGIQDYFEEIP